MIFIIKGECLPNYDEFMLKGIKIRLYPNKTQEEYIGKLLGSYRFVYNQCLNLKKEKYLEDKSNLGLKELGYFFHNDLTKNEEFIWLNNHNTKVLKQSIMTLMEAYKRFFVNGNGFPKFKSKHDNQHSCRFPIDAISTKNNYLNYRLTLTKELKNLKFKCSEKYVQYLDKHKQNIKSATLTKTKSGQYYLGILVDGDLNKQLSNPINNIIGIDLGIKTFIVDSKGHEYENIKIKRNNEKKLAKLHRELSRKTKGGKNREKARIKLAKFYEKLTNQKQQYLHDITNKLLNENQVIAIEDLNIKGMMQNHHIARAIQELSLYDFKSKLVYKANWYGRYVVEVGQYFASSKLCHCCGYKNNDLTLKDREWVCPQCGAVHNRDFNAAMNIEIEGLKILNNNKMDDSLNHPTIWHRLPESTPMESKSMDTRGSRKLKLTT